MKFYSAGCVHLTLILIEVLESTKNDVQIYPPPNAVKFFATVEVLELADDRHALDRIYSVLTEYWRGKNERRNGAEH